MPVERVGEDPAEQHAEAPAARHHETEHAHRLGALRGLGEQAHDQRERDGGDHRAADPLHGAGGNEHALARGEPARDRREREQRHPAEEHSPVAEQVAEPAAEEQEAAEREEVRVHDPRERRLGKAQVLADRRQRHVHDRRVEHDHQVAQAEDEQCEPAGAGVECAHRSPFASVLVG